MWRYRNRSPRRRARARNAERLLQRARADRDRGAQILFVQRPVDVELNHIRVRGERRQQPVRHVDGVAVNDAEPAVAVLDEGGEFGGSCPSVKVTMTSVVSFRRLPARVASSLSSFPWLTNAFGRIRSGLRRGPPMGARRDRLRGKPRATARRPSHTSRAPDYLSARIGPKTPAHSGHVKQQEAHRPLPHRCRDATLLIQLVRT